MIQRVCELLPSEVCDLSVRHPGHGGPGAPLKRYLLDPVLPMLMLLSMSALTVVMLVAVVTAVADMDVRPADDYVTVDPWTGVQREANGASYADHRLYVDSTPAMAPREEPGDRYQPR
jgi:hypothetical protein